jgi:ribosomal protein S18 acetylase RimI-like enzyme
MLRPARSEDAAAICRIEHRAFEHAEERFTLRQARRLLTNPRATAIVAERAGEAIGWGLALTRRTRAGLAGRLYAIAVSPEHTGSGVGRALAEALLGALRELGVTRVYLEVRRDNAPAIALYRSLGFEQVVELPGYYGAGLDAVRMRRLEVNAPRR